MSLKDRLTSIWEGTDLPKFQQLEESKVTEVCVVGGGIAGVSTAYQLAKGDLKLPWSKRISWQVVKRKEQPPT